MRKIVLALALVAMVATVASANTYVWWTLDSATPSEIHATQQGTPAGTGIPSATNLPKQLIIEKPLHGPYTFNLSMWIASDEANTTQGFAGFRTSLWTGDTSTTASGLVVSAIPAWTPAPVATMNTAKDGVLKVVDNSGRARGSTSEAAQHGPMVGLTFTLNIGDLTEQNGAVHNLYQSVGAGLFAAAPSTRNNVVFGPNPACTGATAVDTWAAAGAYTPVIKIIATPEPGTLMLLGLGLVGLIRRR